MWNVLIVDDEQPARDRLRRLLEPMTDYAAAGEARNGAEALERIRELTPDIVLLDISMPGMSGIELLRYSRRTSSETEVIRKIRSPQTTGVDRLLPGMSTVQATFSRPCSLLFQWNGGATPVAVPSARGGAQDDRDVGRFLAYFTFLPMDEVRRLSALEGAEINAAKETLAYEVTKIVHGQEAADAARRAAKSAK